MTLDDPDDRLTGAAKKPPRSFDTSMATLGTLIAMVIAFFPIAWPIYAVIRWRSRASRPILLGALAVLGLAVIGLVTGASIVASARSWEVAGYGDSLVILGYVWLGQSAVMMIAGIIMRLAVSQPPDA